MTLQLALSITAVMLGLTGCAPLSWIDKVSAVPPDVKDYLDDWTPAPLSDRQNWPADFVVAQDGSGTHTSIQSAINDLPSKGASSKRQFILIKPGTYREIVCAADKAPFSLYAKGLPHEVTLIEGRYNALSKKVGESAHPCVSNLQSDTYGTFASTTAAIFSDDAHLAGFTVTNDAMARVVNGHNYPPGVGKTGGPQAVALSVRGDRIQLFSMRLIGHQDTFFADKTQSPLGRIYVSDSMISGDVDFIFGGARLVIENSLIISRIGRLPPDREAHVLAPSTPPNEALGFLVTRSRLLGQPGLEKGSVTLGRPWDHGIKRGEWLANQSPNGQALIRDSQLGEHLARWGTSTSGRSPDAKGVDAFRMSTFRNEQVKTMAPVDLP